MLKLLSTPEFDRWLNRLRDRAALVKITARLYQFSQGNPGDVKALSRGLYEMRVDYGKGYRIY